MSEHGHEAWIEDLRLRVERFKLLFLQLGYANEPARRALMNSGFPRVSLDEYLGLLGPPIEKTLIIEGIEKFANGAPGVTMGQLRDAVHQDMDEGRRIILLSRAPQKAFPNVDGSSLLQDARFARGPALDIQGPNELPTCIDDEVGVEEVLRTALLELGSSVCADLDRVLYENQLVGQDALSGLESQVLEALDGAGLTHFSSGQRTWNFGTHLIPLKAALADVLAGFLEPSGQFPEVNRSLWKIERILRREIRALAIAQWGKTWRQSLLNGDLASKVLARAQESAYPAAASLREIRDPLEWLSLGELLSLRDISAIGYLGIPMPIWRNFESQIMPIRNRMAHMRNLHPSDATDSTKWLHVVEKNFRRN